MGKNKKHKKTPKYLWIRYISRQINPSYNMRIINKIKLKKYKIYKNKEK